MRGVQKGLLQDSLRVVIAEDSGLLREGLARLLVDAGLDVVDKVGDGPKLVAAVERHRPDIAIVGIRMPPSYHDEGLKAAIEARRHVPHLPVLVLSQYVEERYGAELLESGAAGVGYLLKGRVADVPDFLAAVLAISGAVVAPITVVPVLPVETLARITGALGGDAGIEVETREVAKLPQTFADRFGWEDMTETVARVHDRLPQEERSEACVLAGNYGEAGAIDFFGAKYDLPKAISGHNSYYLWGPRGCSGETVVSVGVTRDRLEEVFGRIEQADTVRCRYCMPDENDLPVYVCQKPEAAIRRSVAALQALRLIRRGRERSSLLDGDPRGDGPQSTTQAPPTPALEGICRVAQCRKSGEPSRGRHPAPNSESPPVNDTSSGNPNLNTEREGTEA